MAAFGWSAGDLAQTVQLVIRIGTALRETGGAAQDYQETLDFLCHLELTLQGLQAIAPLLKNDASSAVLLSQSQKVEALLKEFIDEVEPFDRALGPTSKRGWRHGAPRKLQWALLVAKRFKNLQTRIALPVSTINANLGIQTMSTLLNLKSQMSAEVRHTVTETLGQALAVRPYSFQTTGTSSEQTRPTPEALSRHPWCAVNNRVPEDSWSSNREIFRHKSTEHGSIPLMRRTHVKRPRASEIEDTSVLDSPLAPDVNSLEITKGRPVVAGTAENVLIELERHFRSCLYAIVLAVGQLIMGTIQILSLHILLYARILQRMGYHLPRVLRGDYVLFEDSLGNTTNLPMEYFRHRQVIRGFMKTYFRNKSKWPRPGVDITEGFASVFI